MIDLRSLEGLQQACADAVSFAQQNEDYASQEETLIEFIDYVQSANLQTRSSEEFQRKIWEENPVSAVGMGTVDVEAAINDHEFRTWLAQSSLRSLPELPDARAAALNQLFENIISKIGEFSNRKPLLKIYRVLAAFFPADFTTVAHAKKLFQLQTAMLGSRKDRGPRRHMNVLARLDEALGPAGNDLAAVVRRMKLPWLLYTQFVAPADEDGTESIEDVSGTEKLKPLPAARRRKGLTGFVDGFSGVLNTLEFCRDGVPREELRNHIKTIRPDLKRSSIDTNISVLSGELNVLRWERELAVLTDRGDAVLESGDPNDLMDWLVTHILGVDHVLVILRDEGPQQNSDLVPRLQDANPGWTSGRPTSQIISTLLNFGMVERDGNSIVSLSEDGHNWASRIDWVPEALKKDENISERFSEDTAGNGKVLDATSLPDFNTIYKGVLTNGYFSEKLVERLHAGIWAHGRRHFAVLTGLSGSGKTLLARAYGKAILNTDKEKPKEILVTAVQPGWYDPTALLGYVNPLQGDSYSGTPFLDFMMQAADHPSKPFVAILDEMNLSRPEQYLAPILSAMETGLPVSLHCEGSLLDGVPPSIRYPRNLIIIGTVNMDETTHGLSDKVLDRAFTIEFWDIDLDKYPRWGSSERKLDASTENAAKSLLRDLMASLKSARLHFGWRTVDDVLDYLAVIAASNSNTSVEAALDSVVYAKVMPKLRGDDSQRFRNALDACAKVFGDHNLQDCLAKVKELQQDLESTGSARFWR